MVVRLWEVVYGRRSGIFGDARRRWQASHDTSRSAVVVIFTQHTTSQTDPLPVVLHES